MENEAQKWSKTFSGNKIVCGQDGRRSKQHEQENNKQINNQERARK